jgi:hypothetical protein
MPVDGSAEPPENSLMSNKTPLFTRTFWRTQAEHVSSRSAVSFSRSGISGPKSKTNEPKESLPTQEWLSPHKVSKPMHEDRAK